MERTGTDYTELREKIRAGLDVFSDSREVTQGSVFVAVTGAAEDGTRYVPQALEKGAGCIVLDAENADFTVRATESLLAFKRFLTVVEARSGHVNVDSFGRAYLYLSPFPVAVVAADVVVRGHIAKGQMAPIDIFHFI